MLFRSSGSLITTPGYRNRILSTAPRRIGLHRTLSSAGPGDKSWGDILKSAGDLAKDVLGKVADTVSQVGQAIVPSPPSSKPKRQEPPPPPPPLSTPGQLLPQLFGTGLLGRAIGGLVASAIQQVGKQLEQAAASSSSLYDSASVRVLNSQKLRAQMGGDVQVGPLMGQSMSSVSINGVSTKTINLTFPVYSSSGQTAQAQVQSLETSKSTKSSITVRLPNGSTIQIEDDGIGRGPGGGRGGGETIDVEFTEVRK